MYYSFQGQSLQGHLELLFSQPSLLSQDSCRTFPFPFLLSLFSDAGQDLSTFSLVHWVLSLFLWSSSPHQGAVSGCPPYLTQMAWLSFCLLSYHLWLYNKLFSKTKTITTTKKIVNNKTYKNNQTYKNIFFPLFDLTQLYFFGEKQCLYWLSVFKHSVARDTPLWVASIKFYFINMHKLMRKTSSGSQVSKTCGGEQEPGPG